jgi:hypothetical protein
MFFWGVPTDVRCFLIEKSLSLIFNQRVVEKTNQSKTASLLNGTPVIPWSCHLDLLTINDAISAVQQYFDGLKGGDGMMPA